MPEQKPAAKGNSAANIKHKASGLPATSPEDDLGLTCIAVFALMQQRSPDLHHCLQERTMPR